MFVWENDASEERYRHRFFELLLLHMCAVYKLCVGEWRDGACHQPQRACVFAITVVFIIMVIVACLLVENVPRDAAIHREV